MDSEWSAVRFPGPDVQTDDELMGFLKSVAYSIDQTSTWEVQEGARVPRHITVSIGYQVIHGTVPSLDTNFYGYVGGF